MNLNVFITVPRCTKLLYFAEEGETYGWTYRGPDKRTDIRTDKGEGGSHFTCQHITCDMSVKCNAMQPSSIVQFSTAVGVLTGKYKEVTLKNQALELKFCKKHWRYKNCTEKSLSPLWVFGPIFGNFSLIKVIKKWEKNSSESKLKKKISHHWPKWTLQPFSRSYFDLQKWKFCNGTNTQTHNQIHDNSG